MVKAWWYTKIVVLDSRQQHALGPDPRFRSRQCGNPYISTIPKNRKHQLSICDNTLVPRATISLQSTISLNWFWNQIRINMYQLSSNNSTINQLVSTLFFNFMGKTLANFIKFDRCQVRFFNAGPSSPEIRARHCYAIRYDCLKMLPVMVPICFQYAL